MAAQGKRQNAERLLIEGYEGLAKRVEKMPQYRRKEVSAAGERLVQFYESEGKAAEAAKWRTKVGQPAKPAG